MTFSQPVPCSSQQSAASMTFSQLLAAPLSTINLEDFGPTVLDIQVPAATAPPPIPAPQSLPGPSTLTDPSPAPVPTSSDYEPKKKRKGKNSGGPDLEAMMEKMEKRREERMAAVEAAREKRNALLNTSLKHLTEQKDECSRYLQPVEDFMRSLPQNHLTEFKHKLQNLIYETERAVSYELEKAVHNEI